MSEPWPVVAARIRTERAANRCECDGRCAAADVVDWGQHPDGLDSRPGPRCVTRHTIDEPLTLVRLDHNDNNRTEPNIMVMCPGCRTAYTADAIAEEVAGRLARQRKTTSAEVALPGMGAEL